MSAESTRRTGKSRLLTGAVGLAVVVGAAAAVWNFALKDDSGDVDVALVKGAGDKNASPIFSGTAVSEFATKMKFDAKTTQPVELGDNLTIVSGQINKKSDGSVDAQVVVALGSNGLQLGMTASATDKDNWSFTANTSGAQLWSPAGIPAFTLDPNTLTGSISKTDGALSYSLTGASHIWNVGEGVTYTSVLSLGSGCPMADASKCPATGGAPYLGMNGTLAMTGVKNQLSLTGGLALTGNWARFEGTTDAVTLGEEGAASFTVDAPTFTMWRGPRTDSYDAGMQLPELGSLSNGTNMEFCGGFNIAIPKVVNKGTSGCLRWSPKGFVIGQVALGADISGSMGTTGKSANASVKGVSWTNIADSVLGSLPSRDSVFDGVSTQLLNKTFTLGGKAVLPGTVAKALNLPEVDLPVDVRGKFSSEIFELDGTVNVDISAGSEPFHIDIKSMNVSISAKNKGFDFGIGSTGTATLGYAPNTRDVQTTTQLAASTESGASLVLAVNARGTASAADANKSGISADSRLTDPRNATFVWPDQFGIKGMNLWNMTVQIGFVKGSPSLAYSSTTYLDPLKGSTSKVIGCSSACTDKDWLMGSLVTNFSMTNPCFAYGFDSTSGSSGLSIDGGVLRTSRFQFGMAPAGCSVKQGNETTTLPVGFAGFAFTTTFGDDPSTLSFATSVSKDGFVSEFSLDTFTIAKTKYTDVGFLLKVDATGSQFSFGATMDSGMGDASVKVDFTVNGKGYNQHIDLSLTDWGWGDSKTVDLTEFTYVKDVFIMPGECGSYDANAKGKLKVGSQTAELKRATISIDCTGVKKLDVAIDYKHVSKWNGRSNMAEFVLSYPHADPSGKKNGFVYAGMSLDYKRTLSEKKEISPGGIKRTFHADVKVSISMETWTDPDKPGNGAFAFSGGFDASRVGGSLGCVMEADDGDFKCEGKVKFDPSWAGKFEKKWDNL